MQRTFCKVGILTLSVRLMKAKIEIDMNKGDKNVMSITILHD